MQCFKRAGQEIVTFPILSRLAQYLLETNPKIVSFLGLTYSHIFLDEFQDTTGLQYELLKTAFLNSNNVLTAVGDTKQRIMLWAGAMDGIFEEFQQDFAATPLNLLMNFRSAPRLVQLQNHLAANLLGSDIECIPRPDRDEEEGIVEFWQFDDYEQEALILAEDIRQKIEEEDIDPREICLLYKQRPDHYATSLQEALANVNIKSRIENELQDLLVEPIIQFCINFILAAIFSEATNERSILIEEYGKFHKVYDDTSFLNLEKSILKKLKAFKNTSSSANDWNEVEHLIQNEIEEVSFSVFSSYYPQYNERTFFNDCLSKFYQLMREEYEVSNNLQTAAEKFSGKDCVPIMTIHKSKGLEFSVVYFIGFEDQNFWSYRSQPE